MFVVLGSSAAALIGLLFIATSLHLKEIVNNPVLQRRAFNNTCYLLLILVETLLVLTPQPMGTLGAELITLNLLGLWLPIRFVSTFFRNKEAFRRAGGQIHRATIFIASFVTGAVGGAALIRGLSWGIYLTATSCTVILVRVVFHAWSIMVSVGQLDGSKPAN
jgi:hypothetical protein